MITDDLVSSELRYRRLFEAARDGILLIDPETRRIVDVNPYLVELLGFPREHFLGRELFEIGMLRDETASQQTFRELLRSGYVRYDHLPLEAHDGRRLDVGFVSNLYREGEHTIIQCNIRDISERRRAEVAAQASEERFRLLARAVSDVIWDWDILGDVLWWSDGTLATFGFSPEDHEPGLSSRTRRIHPEDRSRVVDGMAAAIAEGRQTWKEEYRFQRHDGGYAYVQDCGYILHDETGRAVRMVGGMRDHTAQKSLELLSLRAQRMESIGTLSGGIAHDLNNLLTPIMMAIELLRLDATPGSGTLPVLDRVQVSCQRAAELVRQLLSFARGVDGQRIAVRLPSVISEVEAIVRATFPRQINIVTEVPAEPWPVLADPTQLHQVLLNLAINARDAMPQGGTLTLAAENLLLTAPAPAGGPPTPGAYGVLRVTDTGCGIPLTVRERIFEPFFTTKDVGKGTGLGLATAYAVVKGHAGFITVESEMGQGTTFHVYLPAEITSADRATPPPADPVVERGRGELVLVIDDEAAIRDLARLILETFGYQVLTAPDGAAALTLYRESAYPVALVVTDMMMPVMDGAAVIAALRGLDPQIRIIAASGLHDHDGLGRAAARGVPDSLAKPYTAIALLQLVRTVLDRPLVAATLPAAPGP